MRGNLSSDIAGTALYLEECYECGTPFAFSQTLELRLRNDKRIFYCPNGHGQFYTRSTREVLAQTQRDRDEAIAARDRAEAALEKLRKRVKSGTCAFCKRHFANVQQHMATKHEEKLKANA